MTDHAKQKSYFEDSKRKCAIQKVTRIASIIVNVTLTRIQSPIQSQVLQSFIYCENGDLLSFCTVSCPHNAGKQRLASAPFHVIMVAVMKANVHCTC